MDVPTVLLIDDDRQEIQLFSMILQREGFRVVSAQVSSQTISFPPNERPIAILLDYKLNSSLSTAQIATILKQSFPATPIFVLSGMESIPADVAVFAQGFINKNRPEELLSVLRGEWPIVS
jgi:FixJ family two-component response regulator